MVRKVRLSWVCVVPLWWTPCVILATMERWLWKVRFLERRLLEVWMIKLIIFLVVFIEVSTDLPIEVVSGIPSFLGNCLNDAFEAIAFFDIFLEVMRSVLTNRLLLLKDQILKLS